MLALAIALATGSSFGQNFALTATANHSSGGAGNFGPTNYNDQVIQAGVFGWVATSGNPDPNAWISYTWSSAQTINQIRFYCDQNTNRTLTAGTVQRWDGSTWQNVTTFNVSPQLIFNVQFSDITTTAIRVNNLTTTGTQASNPSLREIEVRRVLPDNARGSGVPSPITSCGTTSEALTIQIQNVGSNTLSSIPWGATVTGTLGGSGFNQSYSGTFSGSLAPDATTNINLGNLNLAAGGNLTFTVWTRLSGDTDPTNDTFRVTRTFLGTPGPPTTQNGERCGVGPVQLRASNSNNDSMFWYTSQTGGSFVGRGTTFNTPFIYQTTTYWASSARVYLPAASFFNSNTGGTIVSGALGVFNGWAFDVIPTTGLNIDNIGVRTWQSNMAEFRVYVRQGTHQGFVANANAWTLLGTRNVQGQPGTNFVMLGIGGGYELQAGVTYGFYICQLGEETYARSGSLSNNNAHMTIQGGSYVYGLFAQNGSGTNWTMDVRFEYSGDCKSNRVPATATIKPIPPGAEFMKGSPFEGTYNTGTLNDPDIVAESDRITYEIVNPTGFPNAQYGSTWTISSFAVQSRNGTAVPTGHYTRTNPSGAGNFKLEYRPVLAWTDSVVQVIVSLRRLDNGCDTVLTRNVRVAPRPDADFTSTAGCLGELTYFTNLSGIQSGSLSYEWDFGDGNTSTLTNPFHMYAQAGTYNVTLKAISNFGYRDSITKQVSVYELPQTRFTFTNACEGTALQFRDASTLPSGTTVYDWRFGDGVGTSTAQNPSYTYAQPGVYSVVLNVTTNGCSRDFQRWVTQAPRAKVDFTSNVMGQGCEDDMVNFTNGSTLSQGNVGYIWDFGDGVTSSTTNTSHKYGKSGNFNVVLTATTDQGCVDTKTTQVNIKESPNAAFSVPGSCDGQSVVFTNNSTPPQGQTNNYVWEFGDGQSSNANNPSHTYGSFGVYNVKLNVVSSNGCTDMTESSVTVAVRPIAGFFAEPVCQGNPTIFRNNTAAMGNTSYTWDFGNGKTSNDANPVETFANAGSYNVKLVSGLGACTDTASQVVNVWANPSAAPTGESNLNGNGTIAFKANATGANRFQWFFGDGGSSTQENPIYRYPTNALHRVTLHVWSAEGCTQKYDLSVRVQATSVNTVLAGSIKAYPNPTTGLVTIDAGNADTKNWNVTVSNIIGKMVMKPENSFENGKMDINLAGLAQGVYMVNIEAGSETITLKITLTR